MANPKPGALDAPLTRPQAHDVLRYWLASVRLEESLKTRPRARRVKHASATPRLDFPALGQEYFKLPLGQDVARLIATDEGLRRPFDGELAAFFEGWLNSQYRRVQEENELSHLLCFPVIHLPRGELAGVLRCGVRLRFGSEDGKPFRLPNRAERQRGTYPSPPNEVHVVGAPRGQGEWPFFIDARLLNYPLGLSSEEIDALFETLRDRGEIDARQMLSIVSAALEKAATHDGAEASSSDPATRAAEVDVDALLVRLRCAMQALLARSNTRAEVYPVGVVIDGSQAKTTWHLQRELTSLLEEQDQSDWRPNSCLATYLTRHESHVGEAAQRALFPGPALTTHQRSAAEHFWGSTFTSVQGPPGTGKTTLILHLCAEALVRQVAGLLDKNAMSSDLLVVASSNNRAVDNVIDPLCAGDGLPLALRVGSRQVCEQTLCARLRQTAVWLEHAQVEPVGVHKQALEQSLAVFSSLRAQLDAQLAPRKRALADAAEREQLQQTITELSGRASDEQRSGAGDKQLPIAAARALAASLREVQQRLETLSAKCAQKPSMAHANAVARHYEKTAKKYLPPLEAALAEAGLSFELPLPPLETPLALAALMEAWEDGAETFLERLATVGEQVERVLGAQERASKLRALEDRLRTLGPALAAPLPPSGGHDELSRGLFVAALKVREAWAKVHAFKLHEAVTAALRVSEQERSLRPLFRTEPEYATLLCRLFGVWGSTLLSLGNCLPADPHSVARAVIDEAGQCHPAHAVSALMRCKSVMIIGDVHQLSPIIELTDDDEARLIKSCRLTLSTEQLRPYRLSSVGQSSAQSLADRAVSTRQRLVDHFRCQPEIIAISDALCRYGLRVHTKPYPSQVALLDHAVSVLDVRGAQERVAGSLYNELELGETLKWVDTLLARGATPAEIAVITPYRGQLEHLRRGLLERRIPLEFSPELAEGEGPPPRAMSGLALGTVHRFQGGERRIVLFSSVVSRESSLPFLNTRPNLLNVAVSRAQQHFVCLGNRSVLLHGKLTRLLVEAAQPLLGA
jgi:RecA/RadA recombinase